MEAIAVVWVGDDGALDRGGIVEAEKSGEFHDMFLR